MPAKDGSGRSHGDVAKQPSHGTSGREGGGRGHDHGAKQSSHGASRREGGGREHDHVAIQQPRISKHPKDTGEHLVEVQSYVVPPRIAISGSRSSHSNDGYGKVSSQAANKPGSSRGGQFMICFVFTWYLERNLRCRRPVASKRKTNESGDVNVGIIGAHA